CSLNPPSPQLYQSCDPIEHHSALWVLCGSAKEQVEMGESPSNHFDLRSKFVKIGPADRAAVLRLQVEDREPSRNQQERTTALWEGVLIFT
ncbi:hypothetical protein, partial [uncultured Roseobacter sp.]|uniref:hypothetical protein n=1 Tax=uncultured Roseobacter sp. TaxID=114847 RepID=UPI002617FF7E